MLRIRSQTAHRHIFEHALPQHADGHFFTEFTGFSPTTGRNLFAPAMLVGAALMAVGLAIRPMGVAGAAIITSICVVFLIRLTAPGRCATLGIFAYLLFGGLATALLALQVMR